MRLLLLLFTCWSCVGGEYYQYDANRRVKVWGNTNYTVDCWSWQYASSSENLKVYDSNGVYQPQFDEENGTFNSGILATWIKAGLSNGVRIAILDDFLVAKHGQQVASVSKMISGEDIVQLDVGAVYDKQLVGEAITNAVEQQGAKIVNLSFGYTSATKPTNVIEAIRYYANTLFVVAALESTGPQDQSRDWIPNEHLPNVICVNSHTKSGEHYYSGYGTNVFIAAPGRRVLVKVDGELYSSGGTSVAAPHVSSACALIWQQAPMLSVAGVKQQLAQGAIKLPSWEGKNAVGGMLNIYNSLVFKPKALAVTNRWVTLTVPLETCGNCYYMVDVHASYDLVNWFRQTNGVSFGTNFWFTEPLLENTQKFYRSTWAVGTL